MSKDCCKVNLNCITPSGVNFTFGTIAAQLSAFTAWFRTNVSTYVTDEVTGQIIFQSSTGTNMDAAIGAYVVSITTPTGLVPQITIANNLGYTLLLKQSNILDYYVFRRNINDLYAKGYPSYAEMHFLGPAVNPNSPVVNNYAILNFIGGYEEIREATLECPGYAQRSTPCGTQEYFVAIEYQLTATETIYIRLGYVPSVACAIDTSSLQILAFPSLDVNYTYANLQSNLDTFISWWTANVNSYAYGSILGVNSFGVPPGDTLREMLILDSFGNQLNSAIATQVTSLPNLGLYQPRITVIKNDGYVLVDKIKSNPTSNIWYSYTVYPMTTPAGVTIQTSYIEALRDNGTAPNSGSIWTVLDLMTTRKEIFTSDYHTYGYDQRISTIQGVQSYYVAKKIVLPNQEEIYVRIAYQPVSV